jgi:hypothetical protein
MSECKLQWDSPGTLFRGGNRRNLGHAGRKHIGIPRADINKRCVRPYMAHASGDAANEMHTADTAPGVPFIPHLGS